MELNGPVMGWKLETKGLDMQVNGECEKVEGGGGRRRVLEVGTIGVKKGGYMVFFFLFVLSVGLDCKGVRLGSIEIANQKKC